MFSVDNFYTIFNSHYGGAEKNNTLYTFTPHGSKNWLDVATWGITPSEANDYIKVVSGGAFLMHDQEPFSFNAFENFSRELTDPVCVKKYKTLYPERAPILDTFLEISEYQNSIFLSHAIVKTIKFPIICHSEKNSQDIKKLTDNNWIDCYYWWHGMIARDWFRHWQKHHALITRNKSNADYRFLIYSRDFAGTREYRKSVIDHLTNYQNQVNYNWNLESRCPTLSASINVEDANNSAIHLVCETLFDTEKIYLTEKVFKPMVMCQPFIVFGPPKSLQYLRDYGFKTFDSVWTEEYDSIVDSVKRKQAILHLVDSLASMPSAQFELLYQELLPIVEYNRKHFYSTEFQDILWNELQKNCSEALLKQQELSEQLPGGTWVYYLNSLVEQNYDLPKYWKEILLSLVQSNGIDQNLIVSKYPKLANII